MVIVVVKNKINLYTLKINGIKITLKMFNGDEARV